MKVKNSYIRIIVAGMLMVSGMLLVSRAGDMPETEKAQVRLVSIIEGDKLGLEDRIAVNPAGAVAALGERNGIIVIRDMLTGKLINTVPAHEHQVIRLAFSKDGKLLASCDQDTLKIWDVELWKEKATIKKTAGCRPVQYGLGVDRETPDDDNKQFWSGLIDDISFSADNRFLIATGKFGDLEVWKTATWKKVVSRQINKGLEKFGDNGAGSHVVSPDGELLARINNYGAACGIEIAGLQKYSPAVVLKSNKMNFRSLGFAKNGTFVVANDYEDMVHVWESGSWKEKTTFYLGRTPNASLAIGKNDSVLVFAGKKNMEVRDTVNWKPIAFAKHGFIFEDYEPLRLSFFDNDTKFIIQNRSTFKIFETETWKELTSWKFNHAVEECNLKSLKIITIKTSLAA